MKVRAIVQQLDDPCYRYRVTAFAPALQRAGCSLEVSPLPRGIAARLLMFARLGRYDAVLLQRRLMPRWQARLLRCAARRLVFDFDDAIFRRDSYDPRGPRSPSLERRFAAVVAASDTVVAGNAFLAARAAGAGASSGSVVVIPDCVDPLRYTPCLHGPRDDGLSDLVWIGSSSTLRGLERQRGLWAALALDMPGLRLRIISDRFPEFGPLPVVAVPWKESTEAAELASGHIGISWMPDDDWSRGKCGLKILQYMAAGLPVVANPVGIHMTLVEHGVNGFLAGTQNEWIDAVGRLRTDADLRRRMGSAGRRVVRTRYSVSNYEAAFAGAVMGK